MSDPCFTVFHTFPVPGARKVSCSESNVLTLTKIRLLYDLFNLADREVMITQIHPTRSSIRLPCKLPAEIIFFGDGMDRVKKAVISNISTTGIQILSPSFIATGQKVQASFKVPGIRSYTTFRAEVMRIESLQGKMIGHFLYALGAKFVDPEKAHEKQITGFISNKTTFSTWRMAITGILFLLSGSHIRHAILENALASSTLAQLNLYGVSELGIFSWLFHPGTSAIVFVGLFSAAFLCAFNHKTFVRWGFFWATSSSLLSAAYVYAQQVLILEGAPGKATWLSECLFTCMGISLLFAIAQLAKNLHKMDIFLSAQKPPPGPTRPTFTIL